jgi:hypothetical protein
MQSVSVFPGHRLGLFLGVLVSTILLSQSFAVAQPPKDKKADGAVHRIVILQGPNRSVHYVTSGNLSAGDRVAAYDLERAENDLTYANDLHQLKQQYVQSERVLEPQRRFVQEQLYGTQISYSGFSMGYGNYGYGARRYYYPYAWGGYGYGGFGGGLGGALVGSSYNVTRSLQYGMGNEGVLKNALVRGIAQDASSDYAAAAAKNYQNALSRAASSPVLSRDLSLRAEAAPAPSSEPAYKKGDKVTLWVGNDKYAGTVREDRAGWVVIQTDKAEVTIRKSEITRSEAPSKK